MDPDQTALIGSTLFASILNSSVRLGNYLRQTTSADDIFRCIFFLGALRVNVDSKTLLRLDRMYGLMTDSVHRLSLCFSIYLSYFI